MSQESIQEGLKIIFAQGPMWAVISLAVGILCWRLDKILKELFAGVRGLLLVRRQTGKPKAVEKKSKPEPITTEPQKAMQE
jgi:hypothetical protein